MSENNMVRFLGIVKHCKADIDPQTAQEKAAGGRNYMQKFILAKYSQDPGDSQEAKVFIDLSHAPDDILLAILNQLTQLPDLIRCTRVCRHWKYLIEETGCPSIQVLSRKTLLPLPVFGKHPLDEKACDQYDSTLFEVTPYITRKLMKILFTKLRKHLKVVSLDMISNYSERLEFKVNSLKQNLTPAEHSFSDSYLKKMTCDSELFFENLFDVEESSVEQESVRTYPSLFKLDDEFVNILRDMPNLKWLNLFNVEITKECLNRLADAVGDRLEALILGNDRYAVQPITPFIEEFIPKFTTLRYFALPLCYNEYCDPIAVLPYLPSTLVSLDIYGKFSIPIDSNIGQLSVICPNLKSLAINVHESVDMIELNKVAKGLETLRLRMFHKVLTINTIQELNSPCQFAVAPYNEVLFAPNLRTFELEGMPKDLYESLFENHIYVTNESIDQLELFLDLVYNGIAANSKHLTKLKMSMPRPVQKKETLWHSFNSLKHFENLEQITLQSVAIRDYSLTTASKHGKIQKLTLSGCNLISTTSILDVVKNCQKSLRYLSVDQMIDPDCCEKICAMLDETRGSQNRPTNSSDLRILVCRSPETLDRSFYSPISNINRNLHPWLQWTSNEGLVDNFMLTPTNSVRLCFELQYESML